MTGRITSKFNNRSTALDVPVARVCATAAVRVYQPSRPEASPLFRLARPLSRPPKALHGRDPRPQHCRPTVAYSGQYD